jgi:hypothetical protein
MLWVFYLEFFLLFDIYKHKLFDMTEIVIFQPNKVDEITINKTEREILYDRFERNASIPAHHFQSFFEMETRELESESIKSSMPSILIKKILPYCIPIIRKIPEFTVKKSLVDIFKKKTTTYDTDKSYSISLQINYPIECIVDGNQYIKSHIVPTYDTFNVIGIKVPKKIIQKINKSIPNLVDAISIEHLLKSGAYGLQDFHNNNYTQTLITDIIPLGKYDIVYFESDEDSRTKIQSIMEYIEYTNLFYTDNFSMVYDYLQQKKYKLYIKKEQDRYNINNPVFFKKINLLTKQPVHTQMEKLLHARLDYTNERTNYITLINHSLLETYNKIKLLGDTHVNSKKLLHDLEVNNENDYQIDQHQKNKFKKNLEYAKKKAIAINKFNVGNLVDLNPGQKKVVELEFVKLEKYYETQRKHIPIYDTVSSLFWALSVDNTKVIKERLNELEKELKIPTNLHKLSTMIQAGDIDVVCPHVIDRARHTLKPYKNDIKKSGEIRDHLIKTYSLPAMPDGHYCKICGELIADTDDDEIAKYVSGKRVSFVVEYDMLKTQIWKEVVHIITGYVKFKDSVNIAPIITSITNSIRPELGSIESNLIKIKTNNKDSIKELMGIYTTIYTFAIVVHMINKNYGKITFSARPPVRGRGEKSQKHEYKPKKNKNPLKPVKKNSIISDLSEDDNYIMEESPLLEDTSIMEESPLLEDTSMMDDTTGGNASGKDIQMRLQNIINNALYLVMRIKNIAINNVSSLSSDAIKPLLLNAFKWAGTLSNTAPKYEEKKPETANFLGVDPIYKYLIYAHNMNNYYNNKEKKLISYGDTKTILGRDLSTIESDFKYNKSIYETAPVPPNWNGNESLYTYDSFKYIIEYVKGKQYNKNAVPYSSYLNDHIEKFKHLKVLQNKLHQNLKMERRSPMNNIELQDIYAITLNDFSPGVIKIENHYCNTGERHKFNIFIYQKANFKGVLSGPRKEFPKSDILNWLKTNDTKKIEDFKKWFIVDEKCSKCNTLSSKVKNLGIEKTLEKNHITESFFSYFENRCPKGELHDFTIIAENNKGESDCTKCHITKTIIDKQDKKFYDKYQKIFKKIQTTKLTLEKKEIQEIFSSNREKTPLLKSFPPWKINNGSVLELSRLVKIKYNILINIGLIAGIKYKLIESEKINPHMECSDEALGIRNIYLYDYYLYAHRFYYTIKNYDAISDIPLDLKTLMSKNKIRDLHRKLPDINVNFMKQYEYYKINATPTELANFLLHSLCNTILTINTNMKKALMTTSMDVIKHITNTIVNTEKTLSEPDASAFVFGSSLSYDDVNILDEIDLADAGDDIMDGYTSQDDQNIGIHDMVDEEPDDEFAINDMDIDMDNMENFEGNPMDF